MHIFSCRTDQLQAAASQRLLFGNKQSFCLGTKMGMDLRKRPAGPSITDLPTVFLNQACKTLTLHSWSVTALLSIVESLQTAAECFASHMCKEAMSKHSQNIANHRPGLPALSGNKVWQHHKETKDWAAWWLMQRDILRCWQSKNISLHMKG